MKTKTGLALSPKELSRVYRHKDKEYRKSIHKSIECICPLCGQKHMQVMFWTGRGVPRIRCRFYEFHFDHYDLDEHLVMI